jgi:hypothetical protein
MPLEKGAQGHEDRERTNQPGNANCGDGKKIRISAISSNQERDHPLWTQFRPIQKETVCRARIADPARRGTRATHALGIGMNAITAAEEVGQQFSVTRSVFGRSKRGSALRKLKHPSGPAKCELP